MRAIAIALLFCGSAWADGYRPADPKEVAGYHEEVMPCHTYEAPARVECKGGLLDGKSLRELSILRNTIFARWGWDGYRKPWLRTYFHAQKWFTPNPKFSYKLLSEADRKNAHFIGVKEQSFREPELRAMREAIEKRRKSGPLSPDDQVELGLIDRAAGSFALDDDKREAASDHSLDRLLRPAEVRQLSLRDLRLLRNTIYARRGRRFKSTILQDHFGGMSWYHVDPAYTDARLTQTDQRNIALIKSVENELGGPLTDEDWLIEPATDGA
jgi:hypothetical protein